MRSRLHQEVLALRKAKFGPDHPSVLWSTWGVTAQLFKLNRAAEALPMIEEVVERAVRLKVQPDLVGLLNNQRSYFQQANDVAGCRKTAELWEKLASYRPSKSLQRRLLSGCDCRRPSCVGQVPGGRAGGRVLKRIGPWPGSSRPSRPATTTWP